MKKLIIIIGLGCGFVSSCKKDETLTPSNSGNVGTTSNPNVSPISSIGTLLTMHYDFVTNGVQSPNTVYGVSMGTFYLNATNDPFNVQPDADAGVVSINGIQLKKQNNNGPIVYSDSTYSYNPTSVTWSASGNGTIPAFSVVDSANYPTYTGWGFISDGATKSSNFSVTLSNYSGADEVHIDVSDGPKTVSQHYYSIPLVGTVTAAKLGTLNATSNGYVMVTFYKNSVAIVNGKNIKMQKAYAIYKSPFWIAN